MLGMTAALVICWAFVPGAELTRALLILALVTLGISPALLARLKGRTIDIGEPIYLISAEFLLLFPLRALYLLINPHAEGAFTPVPYDFAINNALILAGAGYLMLLVGYYARFSASVAARLPAPRATFSRHGLITRAVMLYAIGSGIQIYLFVGVGRAFNQATDYLSGSGAENVLLQFGLFQLYGLVVIGLCVARETRIRRGPLVVMILMLGGAAILALTYVNKAGLLLALFGPLLALHYRHRALSALRMTIVAVVVALLVFPFVGSERALINSGALTGHGLSGTLQNAGATLAYLTNEGPAAYFGSAVDGVFLRSNGVDSLALVVTYTPSGVSFARGWEYLAIPAIAYVPRAIWPGKPLPLASSFGPAFLGINSTTSFSLTMFGDLYVNFGVPGVLLGGLGLGLLFRLLYEMLIVKSNRSDVGLLIYIVLLLQFVMGFEQEVVPVLAQVLKMVPFLIVISLFLCLSRRKGVPTIGDGPPTGPQRVQAFLQGGPESDGRTREGASQPRVLPSG
jgi:hypothetical protein